MKEAILERMKAFPGEVSLYYKDLTSGESFAFNDKQPMTAASIMKIPVMMEAFRRFENGTLKPTDEIALKDSDRVPPCGILTFMHAGLSVSIMDLIWLMITISDNVATNILVEHLGVKNINDFMHQNGAVIGDIQRKLFDSTCPRNLTNTICAYDMGILLEKMYCGKLISEKASHDMLQVLSGQQLNGKIPARLPLDMHIAHKTGEVDNVTHDVGIIYAKKPFILCMCSQHVNSGDFNHLISDIAYEIFENAGKVDENLGYDEQDMPW